VAAEGLVEEGLGKKLKSFITKIIEPVFESSANKLPWRLIKALV